MGSGSPAPDLITPGRKVNSKRAWLESEDELLIVAHLNEVKVVGGKSKGKGSSP